MSILGSKWVHWAAMPGGGGSRLPGRFGVVALAAGSNLDELAAQIERHRPEIVSVGDARKRNALCAKGCE